MRGRISSPPPSASQYAIARRSTAGVRVASAQTKPRALANASGSKLRAKSAAPSSVMIAYWKGVIRASSTRWLPLHSTRSPIAKPRVRSSWRQSISTATVSHMSCPTTGGESPIGFRRGYRLSTRKGKPRRNPTGRARGGHVPSPLRRAIRGQLPVVVAGEYLRVGDHRLSGLRGGPDRQGELAAKPREQVIRVRDRAVHRCGIGTGRDVELGCDQLISEYQAGIGASLTSDGRTENRQQLGLGICLAPQREARDRPCGGVVPPEAMAEGAAVSGRAMPCQAADDNGERDRRQHLKRKIFVHRFHRGSP